MHFYGAVIYWIRNDEWQHEGAGPSTQGSADAVENKERCVAEGRQWENPQDLILDGAGGMPPSTKTNFLPHLATPPFSAGFVVEASVRNIHMRQNRGSELLRGRHSLTPPRQPLLAALQIQGTSKIWKKTLSLGKEEHLVEKQRVNVSTTAPPPFNLPALEFELHSAVIETRLFNTGANYCLLMQGALIDTAITQLCKAGEYKMRWKD